jgi:hypothetical protein
VADARPDAAPGYYSIGGSVAGLVGTGLVLTDNGGDDLPIAADGAFTFPTPLMAGQTYAVTVGALPPQLECLVTNANGTVLAAPVTDISVVCHAPGMCPTNPVTFTTNAMFTLPTGCTSLRVDAYGGGGAGGAKHMGNAAAAGGTGGHATRTLGSQAPATVYAIGIGLGGTCDATTTTAGGYAGGRGGTPGGGGTGGDGAGATAPPGGLGGAGSTGGQPGGAGGNGGYGGGGGGGGGDTASGNSGGAATVFQLASTMDDYVVAGGGGAAGASDQNGDVSGPGGAGCDGYDGANGVASLAGTRSAGGGGGGACFCLGGTCDVTPTPDGAAGGIAGTGSGCTAAQDGAAGWITITFP